MSDTPDTPPRPAIPDVLAQRYTSRAMLAVWSPEGRIVSERRLWVAVMKAQAALGVEIPPEAIAAYEAVLEQVDLADIEARERVLRHDVKARIESYNAAAGHEHIHKGMTSRDLTDNVEQVQVRRSLVLLREKTAAALLQLAARAVEHAATPIVGRTHHVPAQPTTLGKRLAMFGETLLRGFERLDDALERYPLRGIKGAVGTRLDQLTLLDGTEGTPGTGGEAKAGSASERLGGLEQRPAKQGEISIQSISDRDAQEFGDYFAGKPLFGAGQDPVFCTGPLTYVGQDAVKADIENFKAALQGQNPNETFLP